MKRNKLIIQNIETRDKDGYEGIYIKTNVAELKFEIDSEQSCCENFGYFSYNEFDKPLEHFIGAEIYEVSVSNNEKENKKVFDATKDVEHCIYDIDAAVFINIKTSKGKLQIVIYNEHNGYYGHSIRYSCMDTTGKINEKDTWR